MTTTTCSVRGGAGRQPTMNIVAGSARSGRHGAPRAAFERGGDLFAIGPGEKNRPEIRVRASRRRSRRTARPSCPGREQLRADPGATVDGGRRGRTRGQRRGGAGDVRQRFGLDASIPNPVDEFGQLVVVHRALYPASTVPDSVRHAERARIGSGSQAGIRLTACPVGARRWPCEATVRPVRLALFAPKVDPLRASVARGGMAERTIVTVLKTVG